MTVFIHNLTLQPDLILFGFRKTLLINELKLLRNYQAFFKKARQTQPYILSLPKKSRLKSFKQCRPFRKNLPDYGQNIFPQSGKFLNIKLS